MGLLSTLFGRTKLKAPNRDRFFSIVTAADSLRGRTDIRPSDHAGIVFNPEVGSVAVIADRLSKRRFRLREGDRVGTARVVEIRPDEVVFAISTFGAHRQAVLRGKKEREQEE